jgi:hypothetical protein
MSLQMMANPFDDAVRHVPVLPDTSSLPVAEQFHLAVQAVLAIDTHILFENWSVSAFAQLRKAALHAAQLPRNEMLDVLDAEAADGADVLLTLIDIVHESPIRDHQVCEVLGILLECPSWRKAADASPALKERIATHGYTSPEVLAKLEGALQAQAKAKGRSNIFSQKVKRQLKHLMFGCGQKRGEGVSSPRSGARRSVVGAAGGA